MNAQNSALSDVDESLARRGLAGREALLACGILCSLIWIGTDIFAALSYQGYHYPFDPISGLSATGAPTRASVVQLGYVYVVLKIVFALGVWICAGHGRSLRITACLLLAFGVADLASSFFPWNPTEDLGTFVNVMHSIFAGGVAVVLILLTIAFGAGAGGRWFRLYSYGTLLLMIVMGALPLLAGLRISADAIPERFGAGERVNAYGFMLWMVVLAVVLLRSRPSLGPAGGGLPDA